MFGSRDPKLKLAHRGVVKVMKVPVLALIWVETKALFTLLSSLFRKIGAN